MPARYNKKDVRNAFESAFNTYAEENTPYRIDITGTEDEYKYKYQIPNDMRGVMNVVAANQKGIKRIRDTETIEGAEAYAARHPNWAAVEADITGPNGQPDGIPEVFITDSTGKIRVVNGYTTFTPNKVEDRAYEYIPRDVYVNKKGNEAFRKAFDKEDFKRYLYDFGWDAEHQKPLWKNPVDDEHFEYLKENQQLMKVLKTKQDNTKISPKRLWDHYVLGNWIKNIFNVSRYVKELVPNLDSFVKARILGQAYNLTRAALIKHPIYMAKALDWTLIGPERKKLENDSNFKAEMNNRTVEWANAVAGKGKTEEQRNAMKEDLITCTQCAIAFAVRVILSGKSFGDDSTIFFGAVYNDKNNLGTQINEGVFQVASPLRQYTYQDDEIKWGAKYRNKQKALKDQKIVPANDKASYNEYMTQIYNRNKANATEEYMRNAVYKRDAYNNQKYNVDLEGYGKSIPKTDVNWEYKTPNTKIEQWKTVPRDNLYAYSQYLTNGAAAGTILGAPTRKGQGGPGSGGAPPPAATAVKTGGTGTGGGGNPFAGAGTGGSTGAGTGGGGKQNESITLGFGSKPSQENSPELDLDDENDAEKRQVGEELVLQTQAESERNKFVQKHKNRIFNSNEIARINAAFNKINKYGQNLVLGSDNYLYDRYNNVKVNMSNGVASKIDPNQDWTYEEPAYV